MNISEKIRKERKKTGLSQEALGEQLSVSRQAITKWENGTAMPDTDKIILLSEFFCVTTDYLLKDYIIDTEGVSASSLPLKNKISWRLKLGIPMFSIFALTWLIFWYLSVRYPTGFYNWDGTVTTGFWGFVEFHEYRFECLAAAFIGIIGSLLLLVDILIKKQFKKSLLIWLRKKSWVRPFCRQSKAGH